MKILGSCISGFRLIGRKIHDGVFPYRAVSEVTSELQNSGSKMVRTLQNRFGKTRTITETVEEISEEEA